MKIAYSLDKFLDSADDYDALNLQNKRITDADCVNLAWALKKCTTLKWINLGQNDIGSEGVIAIIEAVNNMKSLNFLSFLKNKNITPELQQKLTEIKHEYQIYTDNELNKVDAPDQSEDFTKILSACNLRFNREADQFEIRVISYHLREAREYNGFEGKYNVCEIEAAIYQVIGHIDNIEYIANNDADQTENQGMQQRLSDVAGDSSAGTHWMAATLSTESEDQQKIARAQENIKKEQPPEDITIAINETIFDFPPQEEDYYYGQQRFTEDLDKIQKVQYIINEIRSNLESAQNQFIIDAFEAMGKLFHDISWKEDDLDCVRNTHGYRNKHKKKGNRVNKEGAKLDFESLSYLKDLANDEHFQKMLLIPTKLVKGSLAGLLNQINIILGSQYGNHHQGNDSFVEKSYLVKLTSYYHDLNCINKLLQLIDIMDQEVYRELNLTDAIDRYWLGYFFVQFGETSKEISDFIKPETDLKDAENNVIRFLFGKLKSYRNKIKSNPNIIYEKDSKKLSEIKLIFEENINILRKFLTKIRCILEEEFDSYDKINGYQNIAGYILKATEEVNLDLGNLTEKLNLNIIIPKQKSGVKGKLQDTESLLQAKQKKLQNTIALLKEVETETSPEAQVQDYNQLEEFISNNKNAQTFQKILGNNKQVLGNIRNKKVSDINDIIVLQEDKKNEIAKLSTELKNKEKSSAESKILEEKRGFLKQELAALGCFAKIKENLTETSSDITFFNMLQKTIVENSEKFRKAKIESYKSKIIELEREIKKLGKSRDDIKEDINKYHQQRPSKILKKAIDELEQLKEFIQCNNPDKSEYIIKMCVGFLGGYFKDIFQSKYKSQIDEMINQDFLFQEAASNTTATRHKAMHESLSKFLTAERLKDTIYSNVFVWEENLYALIFLLYEKSDCSNKILELMPQELLVEYTESDKEVITSHILITSNIRLQNYSAVEKYFQKTRFKIQKENDISKKGFKFVIGIYINYFSCLVLQGYIERAKNIVKEGLKLIEDRDDKIEFQEMKETLQASSCSAFSELGTENYINLFKNPRNLMFLMDAYLERDQLKESEQIMRVVYNLLHVIDAPKTQIFTSFTYHHLCAKHYRVLALELIKINILNLTNSPLNVTEIRKVYEQEKKFLNLCEDNLRENKQDFLQSYGTGYNNMLFQIIVEKAANQLNFPNFIFITASNKVDFLLEEDFLRVISICREAIELYKQCNDEIDQGYLARVYLCRGVARLNIGGIDNEDAIANFLTAKKIYEENIERQQAPKDVEVIKELAAMFKKTRDNNNFDICMRMLEADSDAESEKSNDVTYPYKFRNIIEVDLLEEIVSVSESDPIAAEAELPEDKKGLESKKKLSIDEMIQGYSHVDPIPSDNIPDPCLSGDSDE